MSYDANAVLFAACPAPRPETERITMSHGSGGRMTSELIETLLLPALRNPALERLEDQAILTVAGGRIALTTDSYVVSPIVFPGGDIGELAVNGTINDLAVGGARPLALTLGLILEEGLAIAELAAIVDSIRRAAGAAGVSVVTGDTKVVGRGQCDKLFINTSGVGVLDPGIDLGFHRVEPGDAILLSGTIGDHGMAIMTRREGIELDGELASDTAPLHELVAALLERCPETRAMRDPTRGGVAASLTELAARRRLGVVIDETAVPLDDTVRGACELFGLDPLLVANEGKLIAVVPGSVADAALEALRAHPLGRRAARVGRVVAEHPGEVVVETAIGGRRVLVLPYSEPLPRIC